MLQVRIRKKILLTSKVAKSDQKIIILLLHTRLSAKHASQIILNGTYEFRFSNPLFDGKRPQRSPVKRVEGRRQQSARSPPKQDEALAASLPPQFNLLDTTLPDFSRPPENQQHLKTFTYIDVSPNVSRDSLLCESEPFTNRDFASPEINPANSASGLFNMDDNSSSNSSDIPPALPRKTSRIPPQPQRKVSQYDNVQQHHHSPLTFAASAPFPSSERPLPSLRSVSTLSSFQVMTLGVPNHSTATGAMRYTS